MARVGIRKIHIAVIAAAISSAVAQNPKSVAGSDRARLIGAWHLISIAGPDGKLVQAVPKGMLIYTDDGHMSVQLMYPASTNAVSNEYVRNGYEASFGSYTVNEENHRLTHHVQGANTGDLLVGKDLSRTYEFTQNGRMVIRSARQEEHWSVTWEHY